MAASDRDQPEEFASSGGATGAGATQTRGRSVPAPAPSRRNVPVKIGDVIADKYVVEEIIGAGGVGVVVAARHKGLDERVAIKFLQRAAAETRENVARFDLEARALARVKSEHVARVMDVGRLATGEAFMVMELLVGEDLAKVIARGPVPVPDAVDHVVQACEAVAAAHDVAIVHRDLKPANLFVTQGREGRTSIKVLDFGISKLRNESHAVTQTLSVVGSPLYMSPEQMETPRDADERADVWSLATILFELVAGKPPFDAPTLPLLCARICTAPPRTFAELGVAAPEDLEQILRRCLSKRPEERVQSVVELAGLLAPFGGRAAEESAARLGHRGRPPQPSPSNKKLAWQLPSEAGPSVSRRRLLRFGSATIAVLGLAFFAGGIAGRGSRLDVARERLGVDLLRATRSLASREPPRGGEASTEAGGAERQAALEASAATEPLSSSSAGGAALAGSSSPPPSVAAVRPASTSASRPARPRVKPKSPSIHDVLSER
jgi:eukaryotic-like serine/threonine-protein kinase